MQRQRTVAMGAVAGKYQVAELREAIEQHAVPGLDGFLIACRYRRFHAFDDRQAYAPSQAIGCSLREDGFVSPDRAALADSLSRFGCVAPAEEADELLRAAAGNRERLRDLVDRRSEGEPIAWLTRSTTFCGLELQVEPGVYVPRWQTEPLARRAASLLPPPESRRPLHWGGRDRRRADRAQPTAAWWPPKSMKLRCGVRCAMESKHGKAISMIRSRLSWRTGLTCSRRWRPTCQRARLACSHVTSARSSRGARSMAVRMAPTCLLRSRGVARGGYDQAAGCWSSWEATKQRPWADCWTTSGSQTWT